MCSLMNRIDNLHCGFITFFFLTLIDSRRTSFHTIGPLGLSSLYIKREGYKRYICPIKNPIHIERVEGRKTGSTIGLVVGLSLV